ncbi:uncharacterized protein LOC132536559 isoform X2 [Erinaceus europaeus]|uniref:Uncharacterized protein LOC132536559 isoform X2 n=1 Tax=Erinaceus europaeus TaxID=9365 RepID=A0ABM3WVF2_ERIEU|nr:uncharacterized protein LOC132536559 isoform X2 [Erinaceus europaeus]
MTQIRGSLKEPAPGARLAQARSESPPFWFFELLRTEPDQADGRAGSHAGCADRTRTERGKLDGSVCQGGVGSEANGRTGGRRYGPGQCRVRPSARRAPAASAQLVPRGVALLRRAPGPGRGGDPGAEEHPGGGQPVHQVLCLLRLKKGCQELRQGSRYGPWRVKIMYISI